MDGASSPVLTGEVPSVARRRGPPSSRATIVARATSPASQGRISKKDINTTAKTLYPAASASGVSTPAGS
jgi:hypothetical protein